MIGIYKITNLINGKKYYGSSADIDSRWNKHKAMLCGNYHKNPHLQNSWNKYSEENFKFEILLLCEKFELLHYEQWFFDNIVKWGIDYNINSVASKPPSQKGKTRSKRFKKKMSEILKRNTHSLGYKHTEEARKNMSKAKIGVSVHTKESKRKISLTKQGENHHNSKLIKERVLMVRRMYLTGKYTQKTLGKLFNTSRKNISNIVNRKTWRYL